MKYCFLISLSLLVANGLQAQFYFKDIVSNQQLQADLALYKENGIRNITIESKEADGSVSEGFIFHKKINKKYTKATLMSRSNISGTSLTTYEYNSNGKIISSVDSSNLALNKITYHYNSLGKIESIKTSIQSADDDFITKIYEEHLYTYNQDGQPLFMLRIKNHSDTTKILFALDEFNNVAIEKDSRNGNKYYYYYDQKNRLTEIVELNDFRQDPTPNYIFAYNNAGLLTQMTVVEEGGSIPDYMVWKYGYENKLRTYERLYTKERKLLGSVTYTYK